MSIVVYPLALFSLDMKRSIARVTIRGQYVILLNSLKIKMFNFLKPILPYESHLF